MFTVFMVTIDEAVAKTKTISTEQKATFLLHAPLAEVLRQRSFTEK